MVEGLPTVVVIVVTIMGRIGAARLRKKIRIDRTFMEPIYVAVILVIMCS